MAVPADPNTVNNATPGQPLPAALLDAFRDYLLYLSTNKPHARVYKASAFSHNSSGNFLAITFDTERYDVGATHSTSSNTSRFTVPTGEAGVYGIGGCVQWATNGTGRRLLKIKLNGSIDLWQVELPVSGNESGGPIYTEYALAAGDYVELQAYQSSGGTLNVNTAANFSPEFFIMWKSA